MSIESLTFERYSRYWTVWKREKGKNFNPCYALTIQLFLFFFS